MIEPLTIADIAAVSAIHREALSEDLLARLGTPFLERLYIAMLASSRAFGFVVKQESEPVGFVLGTTRTSALFRTVLWMAGPALLWRALPSMLARPVLALWIMEALLYPHQLPSAHEEAELLVIALRGDYRNGMWGGKLVQSLHAEFVRRGINSYKVSVYESNLRATRFYEKLGFELCGRFVLFGRSWRLYTYDLRRARE